MIDTLKLSNRLKAAHMPAEQAEALSAGLAESIKESYITREFLDARLAALETKMAVWLISTVGLATLINHWWR
jgi:hypothetical protein